MGAKSLRSPNCFETPHTPPASARLDEAAAAQKPVLHWKLKAADAEPRAAANQ
jgi:hypothetical protein